MFAIFNIIGKLNTMKNMRSVKEQSVDEKIMSTLKNLDVSERVLHGIKRLITDEEIQATQEYANNVSIVRLGYNDHGPVHMRTVALNVIIMMGFLWKAGIKTSLESEGTGNAEDSLIGAVHAAMLHDLGMSIGRQDHELHSVYLALPILDRLLSQIYKDNPKKKVIVRSVALEGISGHMGNRIIHSLEAGIVQVADGCDMTKGRARIPIALNNTFKAGNIHKVSANSIEKVSLSMGSEKPICIKVKMSGEVGLFQIEEVLMNKISVSPAKPYIELYAQVNDEEPKKCL